MRQLFLLYPLFLLLIIGTRSCFPPPTPTSAAPLVAKADYLSRWLDADTDAGLFVDLDQWLQHSHGASPLAQLVRNELPALPWLEAALATHAGLLLYIDSPKHGEVTLLLTAMDPKLVAEQIAQQMEQSGTVTRQQVTEELIHYADATGTWHWTPVADSVLAIGDEVGLAYAMQRPRHNQTPQARFHIGPRFPNPVAWGSLRLTDGMRAILPRDWPVIEAVDLQVGTGTPLPLLIRLHVASSSQAETLAERIDGILTLAALEARQTPWLTHLLASVTVLTQDTTVEIRGGLQNEAIEKLLGEQP